MSDLHFNFLKFKHCIIFLGGMLRNKVLADYKPISSSKNNNRGNIYLEGQSKKTDHTNRQVFQGRGNPGRTRKR